MLILISSFSMFFCVYQVDYKVISISIVQLGVLHKLRGGGSMGFYSLYCVIVLTDKVSNSAQCA